MGIGELNQTDLHEQLKLHYCGDSGRVEVEHSGFVVDVELPDEIVEIQTRNLGKLKRKLTVLRDVKPVRLVHPVLAATHIVRTDTAGNPLSRRKSPKRGSVESSFREISAIAELLPHPDLTIEIALVEVTEFRRDDGKGSWRRGGVSIVGRRLERIVDTRVFRTRRDYANLLPRELPAEFTNTELGQLLGLRYSLVQPMTNVLRKVGVIRAVGKRDRSLVYGRIAR